MAYVTIVGAVVKGGESIWSLLKWGRATINYKTRLESTEGRFNSAAAAVEGLKENRSIDDVQLKSLEDLKKEYQKVVEQFSPRSKWGPLRFLFYTHYLDKLEKKEAKLTMQCILASVNPKNVMDNLEQHQLSGLHGAPQEPECIGMDEPLNWLRINLLNDAVPVIVLTGLGGSGKSTLAKKICRDPQIEGKFGKKIFFFTVSELMTNVEWMFEYCGYSVLKFQSNEDAANKLGLLLSRLFEENPILLVLDDVKRGSEALIEEFSSQLPNSRILVTSKVAFPRFDTTWRLDGLDHNNSLALFRHFTRLNEQSSSYMRDEKLVDKIVSCCKGSPLALKVIGGSLCRRPVEVWQKMEQRLEKESILGYSEFKLLSCLQQSVDMCSENEKLCFMDLGLFPKDQRIPATALTDMWSELYKLDENYINAMTIVHELTIKNLINVIVTRKVGKDEDMYYNNHFIIMHDVLRELAIRQSKDEPFEDEPFEVKERLSIDLNGDNRPEWWVGRNQQGIIGRAVSFILGQRLRVAARILSISTDKMFTSDWCDMLPDKAEVLILNHHSSQYSLPEFTEKMSKLKVLIISNYSSHRSQLNKFELLSSLSNLKRIRLEKVSVPALCILKNLQKFSLYMCNTNQAFESGSIKISDAMPNLVEMSIDYCKDMVKLPDELCNITTLEKLSITNCHGLSSLPQDIAKLENLEVLRLCSCTSLVEMPNSVTGLDKVNCIDISDCVNLAKLPDDIGKLKKLEKLYLKGWNKMDELPCSVIDDFGNLNHTIYVICDKEGADWWGGLSTIPNNLKIEIFIEEANLKWLRLVHS